jgi:mannose-6-phosphate isomerase-like protein (cupin superfamily)
MSGYAIVEAGDAPDMMAEYEGFGEMRFFAKPLDAEQVAFTWRRMPPGTGGKGSYGHRHTEQEEIYFVISGELEFKLGDEVVTVGPRTAVRVSPDLFRSVHNSTSDEAEMVIVSVVVDDVDDQTEMTPDFWPE